MNLLTKLNKLKLFVISLGFFAALFSVKAVAGTYTTGTNISVPISFNAGDTVSAMEFYVSVNGGTLVGLRCGGAGFSNISSGGNKCVIANLGGGARSGVVGTATVRGNSPGTLSVSVSGTLSSTSGSRVSGGFSGVSHTIIQGAPVVPSTTPAGTAPAIVEPPTPVELKPTLVKTKDGKQVEAKDRTLFEKTVNLDNEVTEVVFTTDWDLSDDANLVINSDEEVQLDFAALKETELESDVAQVYTLKKGFSVDRNSQRGGVSVTFQGNTKMTSFGFLGDNTGWNGKLRAPSVLDAEKVGSRVGVVSYAVEVGGTENVLVFDKPVKIVLPNQANRSVGYNQLGVDTKIITECATSSEGTRELVDSSECYYFDGTDAVILTKHFTTFYSFYDYSVNNLVPIIRHPLIRIKVAIVGGILILILGVLLVLVHNKRKRVKHAQV